MVQAALPYWQCLHVEPSIWHELKGVQHMQWPEPASQGTCFSPAFPSTDICPAQAPPHSAWAPARVAKEALQLCALEVRVPAPQVPKARARACPLRVCGPSPVPLACPGAARCRGSGSPTPRGRSVAPRRQGGGRARASAPSRLLPSAHVPGWRGRRRRRP